MTINYKKFILSGVFVFFVTTFLFSANSAGAVVAPPVPDDSSDPVLFLQDMKTTVDSLELNQTRKDAFNRRIDRIIKAIEKGKVDTAIIRADKFENVLEKRLQKPDPKKPRPEKLSKDEAQLLLDMLNEFLDNLS